MLGPWPLGEAPCENVHTKSLAERKFSLFHRNLQTFHFQLSVSLITQSDSPAAAHLRRQPARLADASRSCVVLPDYTPPDRAVTYSLVSHAGRHVGNALPVRAKWDHVHFDVIETACVRAANRIGIEGTMAVRAFRGGVRTCGKPWARAGADEHLCRWRQLATRFVTRIHVRLEEMLVPWDVQPGPWPGEIVCLMRLDAWVI